MSDYTTDPRQIYEAAKYLLVTEYNKSEGKLRLRLIGVRVSSLKDSEAIEAEKNSKLIDQMKVSNETVPVVSNKAGKIDSFFKRKSDLSEKSSEEEMNQPLGEDSDTEAACLESIFSLCPHCGTFIEGNKQFFYQHLDFCIRYS